MNINWNNTSVIGNFDVYENIIKPSYQICTYPEYNSLLAFNVIFLVLILIEFPEMIKKTTICSDNKFLQRFETKDMYLNVLFLVNLYYLALTFFGII